MSKSTFTLADVSPKNRIEEYFQIFQQLFITGSSYSEIEPVKKEGFLEFYVKDSGPGIPEEQKKIIFKRFRQGSESLTRNYEGAGLGLSISKAYVEMLGGKIWVENNVGNNGNEPGSTFFFTIPVCPPVKVNAFIPETMKDNRPA